MMTPEQRKQFVAILDAAPDLTIATVRPDGYPQATTVSFVNDGEKIYFGTWSKSQSWSEIRGVSLGGRARFVRDEVEIARVGALMLKKFPQLAEALGGVDQNEMAIIRIDAEVVSILDYAKGFGHTELERIA